MSDLARETAAVLRALHERDDNTSAHCDRTCALSVETGRTLGLPSDDLALLHWAGQLHDIGKIGIPDRVLFKPARFDADDIAVMRTHPRRGHDILAAIPDPRVAAIANIVLHHHEAVDGSGYPDGLHGDDIPVLARIVCIVDAYDAIATVRPYHAPKRHDEVMRMLGDEQGRKFDPHLLARFDKAITSSAYKAVG